MNPGQAETPDLGRIAADEAETRDDPERDPRAPKVRPTEVQEQGAAGHVQDDDLEDDDVDEDNQYDGPIAPSRPAVPREYAGKWLAWSNDGQHILASGETPAEVRSQVERLEISDFAYEWIPPLDAIRFRGGR